MPTPVTRGGGRRPSADGFDDEENRILVDTCGASDEHEASARPMATAAARRPRPSRRSRSRTRTRSWTRWASAGCGVRGDLAQPGDRRGARSGRRGRAPQRSEPSVLTEQRGAVERASGDLSDLDAELESLRDELRAVRSPRTTSTRRRGPRRRRGGPRRARDRRPPRPGGLRRGARGVLRAGAAPRDLDRARQARCRLERRAAGLYRGRRSAGRLSRSGRRTANGSSPTGATRPDDVYSSLGEAKQAFIEHYRNLWDGLDGAGRRPLTGCLLTPMLLPRAAWRTEPVPAVHGRPHGRERPGQPGGAGSVTGPPPGARLPASTHGCGTRCPRSATCSTGSAVTDFEVGSAVDVLRKYRTARDRSSRSRGRAGCGLRPARGAARRDRLRRCREPRSGWVAPEPVEDVLAGDDTVYAELDEVVELITRLDDEDFEPTLQQKRIIAAVQSGKNVVVRAMAGTGKALRHDQPVLTQLSGSHRTPAPMGRDRLQYEVQGVTPGVSASSSPSLSPTGHPVAHADPTAGSCSGMSAMPDFPARCAPPPRSHAKSCALLLRRAADPDRAPTGSCRWWSR